MFLLFLCIKVRETMIFALDALGPRADEVAMVVSLIRHAPALVACGRSTTFARVLAFLEAHIGEVIYLERVAQHIGMDPSSLSRACSRELGVTFTRLVHAQKIYRAALEMYRSETTLHSIALHVGYPSQSSFSRTFRDVTGLTPLTFKKLVDSLVSRRMYVSRTP